VIRWSLISLALLESCQGHPNDVSVPPTQSARQDVNRRDASVSALAITTTTVASSLSVPVTEVDECLRNETLPDDLASRLVLIENRCSSGLKKLWSSSLVVRKLSEATNVRPFTLIEPSCIRVFVATNRSLDRIAISVVDETNRSMASGSGHSIVAVPARGSLCLPRGSTLNVSIVHNGSLPSVHVLLFGSGRIEIPETSQ
jgi:hypothetical protein